MIKTFCPHFSSAFIWTFPKTRNAFLLATIVCGFTKLAMPTLDIFKNGMVGVHSMMSSSIHEMFSILALQTSEKKTLKNNESNEKQWKKQPWTLAYILVLQAMSSPFSSIFGPDQLNFPPKWCHVYATSIWLQLVLDLGSSFKGLGCSLWLSTNKNAPFCWALDLGPLFKVALSITSQNIKN